MTRKVIQSTVTSEILDRLPPNDIEAERNVLGSILLDHRTLDDVRAILHPEDFYADAHVKIYRAMLAIADDGSSVDVMTLRASLKAHGDYETVGGDVAIVVIAQEVAVSHHAEHYARIVSGHSRRRQVIHAAMDILQDAYNPGSEPSELVSRGVKALSGIEPPNGKGDPEPIGDAMMRAMVQIDEAAKTGEKPGVLTGLYGFDDRFGGLGKGNLVILSGRPGEGKTALACQIANHVAGTGKVVYFATLEMSNEELATRIACSIASVDSRRIRANRLTPQERESLVVASNAIPGARLIVHDRARLSLYELSHAARKVGRDGIGLVVVDYLQKVTAEDKTVKRYEQIGEVTRGLKALARELNCPVLCMCHLGRAAETEDEPKLHHLRESGDIESDADIVFFIRTHPKSDEGEFWKDEKNGKEWNGELIIGKGRSIGKGSLRLIWEPTYTRFTCLDDPQPNPEFSDFSGNRKDF